METASPSRGARDAWGTSGARARPEDGGRRTRPFLGTRSPFRGANGFLAQGLAQRPLAKWGQVQG